MQSVVAVLHDSGLHRAVGRGGVLDLAVRYGHDRILTMDGVRRFADPAYADLSLRMRHATGPGEVFDELVRRRQVVVHASEVERQQVLTVRASRGELVVADTREQVGRINGLTHRLRVITGEAGDAVVTRAGERIGIGDQIATRRNDTTTDVANRETSTVTATDPRGSLTVVGAAGRRTLPADYVRKHLELAYATTAYGAQGATVPIAHVSVGEHTGASSAYVGMPRGQENNTAHLVAESLEQARRQWIDVFGRDRADLGPTHAARLAADAVDRYGPNAPRRRRRAEAPRVRPPEPAPSRPPALPARGIGL
ncbi:MAG: hypothetical protein WAV00_17355 [Nocardioides sp.]